MRVVLEESDDNRNGVSMHQQFAASPRIPVSRLVGHDEGRPVTLVRFTGNGKYCLTAGQDRSVRLWNPSRLDPAFPPPRTGTGFGENDDIPINNLPRALPIQVYEDSIRHPPTALAIDDASTRLLVASDRTAVLIDSVTSKVLRRWHGHTAVINSVALAPETAHVLASASYDATVCLWDGRSNSQRPIQILKEAKDSVTVVHILKSSIQTASVDGCVRTYDVRKGILQCDDCHSPITGLSRTNNGNKNDDAKHCLAISCLDGTIRVQHESESSSVQSFGSATNSQDISTPLICQHRHVAGRYALDCCFTADSSGVWSGSEDGRAILYKVIKNVAATGRSRNVERLQGGDQPVSAPVLLELLGHSAPTCSIASHPNPQHNDVVVTASYDGNCVVWANSHDYMRWED